MMNSQNTDTIIVILNYTACLCVTAGSHVQFITLQIYITDFHLEAGYKDYIRDYIRNLRANSASRQLH